MIEVGSVNVAIRATLDNFQRGVKRAKIDLRGFSVTADRETTRVHSMFKRMGAAVHGELLRLGATFGAVFATGAVFTTLANFEKSMAAVAAITNATDSDLAKLRKTAQELGAVTEFSASQAADGLKFLGMAGFSAEQSIAAIPDVLDLATAAQMDLARAADISSNIMSAFGISANNAASVADILAAASSKANTDVAQLGDAMKYAGPVAAAMGVSMGDTAAAVGTLSDAGIQGSMAGTGLRQVLSSLANATPKATQALKALGLSTAEVNPATNKLTDIVDKLRKKGLDAATALTIFGDRGGPAILALVENEPKLRSLTETLTDVDGEAKRMANTMRDNLAGDAKGLLSAIESIIIALGDAGLTTALRTATQGFTALLRTAASVITTLGEMLPVVGTALLVAFGPSILSAIAFGFGYLGTAGVAAIRAIGVAVAANPLGAIATAVAGAIVAVYHFRDEIRTALGEETIAMAKTAINFMVGAFVAGFETIKFTFLNLPSILGEAMFGAVNAVIAGVNQMVSQVKAGINGLIEAINAIPGVDVGLLDAGSATIPFVANPYADRMQGQREALAKSIKEAMSADYVGPLLDIADGAKTAEDAVLSLDDATKRLLTPTDPGGAGSKKKNPYAEIVRDAKEFIEAQKLEAAALRLTTVEANRLRYEQELFNKAARENLTLLPAQRDELRALAAQMAQSEEATRKQSEALSFAKDSANGFLSDLRSGLMQGKSLWESFGNAALNVLNKVVDKIQNNLVDALFSANSVFGSGISGPLGGIFSLFGFANGGVMSSGGPLPLKTYSNGGIANSPQLAVYGEGRMNEAYVPLPDGRTIPVTMTGAANQNAAPTSNVFNMPISIDATGADPATLVRVIDQVEQLKREVPIMAVNAVNRANKRSVAR